MGYRYLAFDIEITNPIPEGSEDWKAARPLGISCAATLTVEGELKHWYGKKAGSGYAARMSREEAAGLVSYLEEQVKSGYTILTWNGLGFDFDILAEESGCLSACKRLAMEHVDMMFHVFCARGYGLGLDKAARGMGLPGKTTGMDGSMAPMLWKKGEFQKVLDYVAQDVRTTLDMARVVDKNRTLRWVSNSGYPASLPLPNGWLTVRSALELPEPDNSRLRNPWKRGKFTGWMEQAGVEKTENTPEDLSQGSLF